MGSSELSFVDSHPDRAAGWLMLKRILLVAALLAAPAFVVTTTLALRLDATLDNCGPVGDDEFHYWDEIASFAAVGLNGGYFVADEEPARQSWTHFGPHGPVFPVLYGSMARVLGWGSASGPVFNLLLLAAGSLVWLLLVRPDTQHLVVAVFLWATFWPCLLYVPATMQECLHFALAFVLAGLAHRAVNGRDRDGRSFWPFLAVVAFASTLRITWALLLPVWAVAAWPSLGRRSRTAILATIALTVPCLILMTRQLAGGYPNFVSAVSELGRHAPMTAVATVLSHIGLSVNQLFWMSVPRMDKPLEILLRFQILAIIVLTTFLIAARAGGVRVRAQLPKFTLTAVVFVALVIAVQTLVGGILLTLLAAWYGQRNGGALWPILASAAAVACLHVCRVDEYFAADLIGKSAVAYARLALLVALLWLHRQRVADGVELALSLPDALDRGLSTLQRRLPGGVAAIVTWFDPRRFIGGVKRAVSVSPLDDARPYLFAGLNLAITLAVVIVIYDLQYFRDYRVIAPHLLTVLLVLATGNGWRWAASAAVLNLCFLPFFVWQFDEFHRLRVNRPRFEAEEIDLRPYLHYDPAASAWSNTLLCPDVRLANRVRVPPGIGVCWGVQFFSGGSKPPLEMDSPYLPFIWRFNDRWLSRPTRSRFVLAEPKEVKKWQGCQLRLLAEVRNANLYLNLDFQDDTAAVPSLADSARDPGSYSPR
jgi:hypothetical protein